MAMQSRPEIFLVTTVLLVPFLYFSSSIPDVCADEPSWGYLESRSCGAKTTNPETELSKQTCCWKERLWTSTGPGNVTTLCQTCYEGYKIGKIYCDEPIDLATGKPPFQFQS